MSATDSATSPTPPLMRLDAMTCSFSFGVAADERKEKRLLPLWGLARSIKPRISRLSRTAKGGNNLGGGKLGKRFGEGHGQILPQKKKYAMQKIILAMRLQCGQDNAVNQHHQMQIETNIITSPIVRKESLTNGKTRVVTHWIIKGEQTTHERFSYGFTTLEALKAERRESDGNRVDLGIAEDRFSDGSSIFYGLRNSFD